MSLDTFQAFVAVLSIVLFVFGLTFLSTASIPLLSLFPYLEHPQSFLDLFMAFWFILSAISLVGLLDKKWRPIFLFLYAITSVVSWQLGFIDAGSTLACLSLFLGSFLLTGEYKGIKGAWSAVSNSKRLFSIIFVLFLLPILLQHRIEIQQDFKNVLITLALQGVQQQGLILQVPTQITAEEKAILMQKLYELYPDINTYPQDVREKIISEYFRQYLELKKAFVSALQKSFEKTNLRERLLSELDNLPIVRTALELSPYFYVAIVSILISTVLWFAGIFAFLLVLPIFILAGRRQTFNKHQES